LGRLEREISVRRVFTDFDEFADAISGVNGRYIPTAPSPKQWWIDPVRLGRLELQQVQVGAPATYAGDGETNALTVGIPLTQPDAIRIDGHALTEDSFVIVRHDRPLTYAAADVTRWVGVTVPAHMDAEPRFKDAAEWSSAMLGDTRVQANSASLRRVSLLVGWLCGGDGTIDIVSPAAIAAAEEEIVSAVAELLRASTCNHEQRAGRRPVSRDQIIARCLEFFRDNQGQPILVADLCRTAQTTERTLRNVFYEYFGVGPIRFLKARQLQEVRSALLKAPSPRVTVTDIAARFGVWDFSLFARNYRALYGESPSQTLRNSRPRNDIPVIDPDLASLQSWMNYASLRFAHAASRGVLPGRDSRPLARY
jgi:AraC family transcriptional regulator, ethanolamine operon transcriptional activator